MNNDIFLSLEEARTRSIGSQTLCGWCNVRYESTDNLVQHIVTVHYDNVSIYYDDNKK